MRIERMIRDCYLVRRSHPQTHIIACQDIVAANAERLAMREP